MSKQNIKGKKTKLKQKTKQTNKQTKKRKKQQQQQQQQTHLCLPYYLSLIYPQIYSNPLSSSHPDPEGIILDTQTIIMHSMLLSSFEKITQMLYATDIIWELSQN